MDANTRKLERIFDQTVTYQVPLFQRPYVWNLKDNWEPLWEDIQSLLERHLRGGVVHPHFMGAVVLEQLPNSAGSIETRQVIDGQQRFTTLQIFLMTARDHSARSGNNKYHERFLDLVENKRSKIDRDEELYKVLPTNSDRPAFRLVHAASSPDALRESLSNEATLAGGSHRIIDAYNYFYSSLGAWLSGALDDADDTCALREKSIDQRLETLWHVVKECLQLVVIDLDKNDETQVIFETLNARGADLLPADLIKNFLFRKAVIRGEDVELLNTKYWQGFESEFWREVIKQGRLSRPRIDLFISHYLTMMTREEVRSAHLFTAFKAFVNDTASSTTSPGDCSNSPAASIEHLARFSGIFQKFLNPGEHKRLALFMRRLEAVDTATVFPFLLYSYAALMPTQRDEFDRVVAVLESFLMRRLICNLTPKNYNRLFVDLIKAVEKEGGVSRESVEAQLRKGTGDSTRFPDNDELRVAIFRQPLYGRLAQYKVRAVLEALDAYAHTSKTEALPLPSGLTIEHVMPQSWRTHWPLTSDSEEDPVKKLESTALRQEAVNKLGNLTLITSSLNPALSNSAWSVKRPELLKFNKLNLSQYFHGADADSWDEQAIAKRTEHLFGHLLMIWPDVARQKTVVRADT
ncbi:DUF262 domain-containing protein [Pandoraea pneumonica]|uniref:DUF262 domain-containing protein n=1 Tax=Pandoraea pneumonica TaxID=2508299 RepID=UPI003CF34983